MHRTTKFACAWRNFSAESCSVRAPRRPPGRRRCTARARGGARALLRFSPCRVRRGFVSERNQPGKPRVTPVLSDLETRSDVQARAARKYRFTRVAFSGKPCFRRRSEECAREKRHQQQNKALPVTASSPAQARASLCCTGEPRGIPSRASSTAGDCVCSKRERGVLVIIIIIIIPRTDAVTLTSAPGFGFLGTGETKTSRCLSERNRTVTDRGRKMPLAQLAEPWPKMELVQLETEVRRSNPVQANSCCQLFCKW